MKLSAKKSLGQNFLNDQNVLNLIAEIGDISNKDIDYKKIKDIEY